uniref:Uncharacterized protein n=1 Tax=Anguilla anguilla TaxID=7936 RepID=A0A0E9R7B5_ANGAN
MCWWVERSVGQPTSCESLGLSDPAPLAFAWTSVIVEQRCC